MLTQCQRQLPPHCRRRSRGVLRLLALSPRSSRTSPLCTSSWASTAGGRHAYTNSPLEKFKSLYKRYRFLYRTHFYPLAGLCRFTVFAPALNGSAASSFSFRRSFIHLLSNHSIGITGSPPSITAK